MTRSSVLFSMASFAAFMNDVNDRNDSLGDGIFFIMGERGNFLVEPGLETDASWFSDFSNRGLRLN